MGLVGLREPPPTLYEWGVTACGLHKGCIFQYADAVMPMAPPLMIISEVGCLDCFGRRTSCGDMNDL